MQKRLMRSVMDCKGRHKRFGFRHINMRFPFLLSAAFMVSSCSQVEVPEDKYGMQLRLGAIEKTVSGPAVLEEAFFLIA